MKHTTTRTIFSYWDALRGQRAAPDRGEIEPREIRHVLADTFILEIAADREAAIRLAGTRICAFFGRELRGERFRELWHGESAAEAERAIDIVLEDTAGVVAGLRAATDEGASVDFEMILLPLRHGGKPQARILGALSPAVVPPWTGLYPVRHLSLSSLRVLWPSARPSQLMRGDHDGSADARRRHFVVHAGGRL